MKQKSFFSLALAVIAVLFFTACPKSESPSQAGGRFIERRVFIGDIANLAEVQGFVVYGQLTGHGLQGDLKLHALDWTDSTKKPISLGDLGFVVDRLSLGPRTQDGTYCVLFSISYRGGIFLINPAQQKLVKVQDLTGSHAKIHGGIFLGKNRAVTFGLNPNIRYISEYSNVLSYDAGYKPPTNAEIGSGATLSGRAAISSRDSCFLLAENHQHP